jgi:hypothetical protein
LQPATAFLQDILQDLGCTGRGWEQALASHPVSDCHVLLQLSRRLLTQRLGVLHLGTLQRHRLVLQG